MSHFKRTNARIDAAREDGTLVTCEEDDDEEEEGEDEECPLCHDRCGHEERGYCIEDECPLCVEWLENCDCEAED